MARWNPARRPRAASAPRLLAKIAALALLATLPPSGRAVAGLGLSWNAFPGDPGASQTLEFACGQPDTSYRLVATFGPPVDVSAFTVMEAVVDLGWDLFAPQPPSGPLPPFWHFEVGGCNQGFLSVDLAKPSGGEGIETPWGPGGGGADVFLAYAPDYGVPGRGRLLVLATRPAPRTLPLVSGHRYFAFTLELLTCAAGACAGCESRMRVVFRQATLHSSNGAPPVPVTDADPEWTPYVCVNTDGWCGVTGAGAPGAAIGMRSGAFLPVPLAPGPCDPVPAKARTWGRLKALYR